MHQLYFDNFFTSHALLVKLASVNVCPTGIITDVPELRLVRNCCGGRSFCKNVCNGAVSTNLDVTAVLSQAPHMEAYQVYQHLKDTHPPFYDEASATFSEPSVSGQFLIFKRLRATTTSKTGEHCLMLQSASRHPMILMAVKNIRMLEKTTTLGMDM
ncbi:hypothetical protein T4A_6245 [Trichinella pseudospiralis]|nr:hypothetical protein T4A_6245 [Trichinella pseudospiralis]KRZ27103.1 hypothetical protein T4C_7416 [Trichinella pseudospiralis]